MEKFLRTLIQAQQGEPTALEALYAEFAEDVRRVCRSIVLEQMTDLSRSDLGQEAWTRIWLRLNHFLVHKDSADPRKQFRVWLKQTARNEMLRVLEKRQAQKRNHDRPIQGDHSLETQAAGDISVSSRLRQDEARRKLNEAMQQLDSTSRAVITACFFQGCSVQAMSEKLGFTYSEARTRLSRALTELRERFGDSFP